MVPTAEQGSEGQAELDMEHLVPEWVRAVGKGARAEQWPWRRVCAGAMLRSPLYLLNNQ